MLLQSLNVRPNYLPKLQVGIFPYVGFSLGLVILLSVLGVSIWGIQKTADDFEALIHTEEVSDELIRLFADLKDVEDQQREFLLTGRERFLVPYEASKQDVERRLVRLRRMAESDTRLHAGLSHLEELVKDRLQSLHNVLDLQKTKGDEAAIGLILSGHGMEVMGQIRDIVFAMDVEDARIFEAKHGKAQGMVTLTLYAMVVGIGLILVIALAGSWKLQRDLLKQRELELRLFEEKELADIARLLADIGHDIKNLLTPIVMGTQLLEEELQEHFSRLPEPERMKARTAEEVSREVMTMTKNGTRRLQERVKEMADAVKGQIAAVEFGPCRLSKIAGDVMEALRLFAKDRGVQLLMEGLNSLPDIQADEPRLFNAVYNLVNNAIPEVPPGGSVTVRGEIAGDGQSIVLSVADTGKGISPEVRDKVLYGQVMSRKSGGTGLGLKIVRDVVQAHKGSLSLDSVEGKGSTFHIRLPVIGVSSLVRT